ncbi:MAG: hypothetical protein MJK12_09815 [Colwellia sp.]|nr:hypothetical protein [Colwellia sp.]
MCSIKRRNDEQYSRISGMNASESEVMKIHLLPIIDCLYPDKQLGHQSDKGNIQ